MCVFGVGGCWGVRVWFRIEASAAPTTTHPSHHFPTIHHPLTIQSPAHHPPNNPSTHPTIHTILNKYTPPPQTIQPGAGGRQGGRALLRHGGPGRGGEGPRLGHLPAQGGGRGQLGRGRGGRCVFANGGLCVYGGWGRGLLTTPSPVRTLKPQTSTTEDSEFEADSSEVRTWFWGLFWLVVGVLCLADASPSTQPPITTGGGGGGIRFL